MSHSHTSGSMPRVARMASTSRRSSGAGSSSRNGASASSIQPIARPVRSGRASWCAGVRLEGQPQHRAHLGLAFEELTPDGLGDQLEARGGVGRRIGAEQRLRVEPGIAGEQERPLVGEVAIGGGPRDRRPLRGHLDRDGGALGEQLAGRRQHGRACARLLLRPPGQLIWG